MSLQSGYMMMDAVSQTPQEAASEYYQTDWVIELYKYALPTLLKHPAAMQVHIKMMRCVFTNSYDALLRWRGMLGTSLRENVHLYMHSDSRTDLIDCILLGLSVPPNHKSILTTSQRHNFTYDTDVGGFSLNNSMSIDQRGLKVIVQAEAQEFLQPQQLLLNHTVAKIEYDSDGVTVTITNGTVLTADYVLCTFSVGVLQHDDVVFEPKLPSWKVEALSSIDMVCRMSALDLYLALIADHHDRPQKRRSTCNFQRSSGSTLR